MPRTKHKVEGYKYGVERRARRTWMKPNTPIANAYEITLSLNLS